jgi:hypothetical protein
VADELNKLGRFDTVSPQSLHRYRAERVETEPGVPSVFAFNVVAPDILTTLIERAKRLVIEAPASIAKSVRVWTTCSGPNDPRAARSPFAESNYAIFAGIWHGSPLK